MIDWRAAVLPYTFYIFLALVLLDTVLNRVLYFLARYQVWSLLSSELLARIGRLSFIFGEMASILLLLLLIILIFETKPALEHYISLPLMPLLTADILRYVLRTSFELVVLTALLNLSSLATVLTAVLLRLREARRGRVRVLIYMYLSLLTVILTLQHLHQLNILFFKDSTLMVPITLEVTPYLMVVNAFTVFTYAFTVSRRGMPTILMKTEAFILSPIILIVVLGLMHIGSVVPQALLELLTLIFGFHLQVEMLPLILIGLVFFLSACLILWLNADYSGTYSQEAVGLLLIFAATFFFGSIYYYPRVVIGVVLISTSLFKRQATLR